jgi:hypothetical protein
MARTSAGSVATLEASAEMWIVQIVIGIAILLEGYLLVTHVGEGLWKIGRPLVP